MKPVFRRLSEMADRRPMLFITLAFVPCTLLFSLANFTDSKLVLVPAAIAGGMALTIALGCLLTQTATWGERWVESRQHRCPTCGYDLRASPDRCPECGTIFTQD